MIKNISTLFVLLLTVNLFGQNIILQKNTNPKAKVLQHNLNSTNDSLLLKCDTKILKVDIFNEDYEHVVKVDDVKMQIALQEIPDGKFIVETKLVDKIIVFGLVIYSPYYDNSKKSLANTKVVEGKGMMLDEGLNTVNSAPNKSIEYILTGTRNKMKVSKKQKFYWVLTKINNESGSSKTMKLVNKESADRMILKHKQELNSVSGKLNELTVWEVYNTTKFMEHQVSDPDFFYSLTSDLFNTTPYYSTNSKVANL
ncbi:MAG: hypothetical protein AB8B52_06095 [Winogradskyella sp.]|uniref:hypothetical protein n=1 Tax=Winogradskyella sp. TaxID=1883156 RepID=UPI003859ABA3